MGRTKMLKRNNLTENVSVGFGFCFRANKIKSKNTFYRTTHVCFILLLGHINICFNPNSHWVGHIGPTPFLKGKLLRKNKFKFFLAKAGKSSYVIFFSEGFSWKTLFYACFIRPTQHNPKVGLIDHDQWEHQCVFLDLESTDSTAWTAEGRGVRT